VEERPWEGKVACKYKTEFSQFMSREGRSLLRRAQEQITQIPER
jgi:hypothetical protein